MKATSSNALEYAKIMPQSQELEEAVLGACMLESEPLLTTAGLLTENSFYSPNCKIVYSVVRKLFKENHPVNILTVTEELRTQNRLNEIGGAITVVDLTNKVTSGANTEYYCRILVQKETLRELISNASSTLERCYQDDDALDVLSNVTATTNHLLERIAGGSLPSLTKQVDTTISNIELASTNSNHLVGEACGIRCIDQKTSGWRGGRVYILAARPGMGKTTLALQFIFNQAVNAKRPGVFFSCEMTSEELIEKLIANETGIDGFRITTGNLQAEEWLQVKEAAHRIKNSPLAIDDTAGLNIYQLCARARKLHSEGKCAYIFVDYLQLLTLTPEESKGKNRDQYLGEITRALKKLAKDLRVPVIALCQLNRAAEATTNKEPDLKDLRESGNIEQDADCVMFLYRPEYYGIKQDAQHNSLEGIARVICKKHRGGTLFDADLHFDGAKSRFTEYKPIY